MSKGTGDSREQAIAHGMLALDEQNDHLGLAVSGIFAQTVLDAAHREGLIYWRDEYDAPYVAACDDNERLRAALNRIARGNLLSWSGVIGVARQALGDGEKGPDSRDDEPTGGRP